MVNTLPSPQIDAISEYQTVIQEDKPLGYWRLGETSGTTATDLSGNNLNGTYTNGVVLGANDALRNDFNFAAQFDGSNDYVNLGNSSAFHLTNGSLEAWINTTNAGSGHRGIIVKPGAYGVFLFDNKLTIYDWSNNQNYDTGINLADGQWHQVVMTFESGVTGGTKLYVDGQLRYTGTITVANQTSNIAIGAGFIGGQYFTGRIDEASVFNYVLNDSQVLSHYNVGNQPTTGSTSTVNPGDKLSFSINTGTALDLNNNITSYEYRLNDGSWQTGFTTQAALTSSINSLDTSAMQGGEHKLEVKAIDSVNDSTITSTKFVINESVPQITGLDAISVSNSSADATGNIASAGFLSPSVTITDTGNNITEYAYRVDNGKWLSFSDKASFDASFNNFNGSALASGSHTLEVKVVDNGGPIYSSTSFQVNTAPTTNRSFDVVSQNNLFSKADSNFIGEGVSLSLPVDFTVTDSDGTVQSYQFVIKDDNGTAKFTSSLFNSTTDFINAINTFDTSTLASGNYTIEAIILDNLGVQAVVKNLYQASVLEDSPVAYYRLEETNGSTVAVDISGNNLNGTYVNFGNTLGQAGSLTANSPSTSVYFDGSNDYIQLNNLGLDTSAGAKTTVEFWMRWDGKDNSMPFGFTSYDLYFTGGRFGFNTGNGDLLGISSSGLANQWVHVTAVFHNGTPSATNNELYINGVKQNLTQMLGTPGSRTVTTNARIGIWNNDVNYMFRGNLDEFAIYNRTLSSSEILQHYQIGKGIFAPSSSLNSSFTINSKPTPVIDAIAGDADNIITPGNFNFGINSGTLLDKDLNIASFEYTFDGTTWKTGFNNISSLTTAINNDGNALVPGSYTLTVKAIDQMGAFGTNTSTFTIEAGSGNLELKGFDSSDSDGVFGGADSNPDNLILLGSTSTVMSVEVNNPNASNLTYQFQVDSNNDGTFENIGSVSSNSAKGAFFDYNPALLKSGTWNTKVIVSDGASFNQELSSKVTVTPWLLQGVDSVDTQASYFGDATDVSVVNSINKGTAAIYLSAGVSNATGVNLTYQFQIDSNRDGTFEDIQIETSTDTKGTTGAKHGDYNPSTLDFGTYETRVIVTDANGLTQTAYDTFTVVQPQLNWSARGLDSADSATGIYGDSTDANINNRIVQGTTSIIMTGGVNNPSSLPLSYTFQIDSNNDGTFETITTRNESTTYGTFYDYRWGDHRHVNYNPSSLSPGTYNTRLIVTDSAGRSETVFDSFTVDAYRYPDWSIKGMDPVDSAAGIYGDGTDASVNNTITQGTTSIIMTGGVNNPSSVALSYTFQIDSNNDGTFETIATRNESTTYGTFYDYRWGDHRHVGYNPSSLAPGTYNTKLIVTDASGFTQEGYNSFTINPIDDVRWTLRGIDPVDSAAGIYGDGTDASVNNTITQGTTSIIMTAGVNNPSSVALSYTFQIDSNNDGTFETIATRNESTTYGTFYDYRWGDHRHVGYNPSSLAPGTYNTKIIVTDGTGYSQESISKLNILPRAWSIAGIDAVDSNNKFNDGTDTNDTNTISSGTSSITLSAAVNNTGNATLSYLFQIDSDKDGTFEDIGAGTQDSVSGSTVYRYATYNPSLLTEGNYDVRLRVTDSHGNFNDSFNVLTVGQASKDAWSVLNFDPVDSNRASDALDSNTNNIIDAGTSNIFLTAGVENTSGTELKYDFYVDANKDGTFELITSQVSSAASAYAAYNPANLTVGTYNTKVVISDTEGNSVEKTASFTVDNIVPFWSVRGLDSADSDKLFGGTDDNLTNTVNQQSNYVTMVAGIENPNNARLTYQFQIDSNKDGIFENIDMPIMNSTPNGAHIDYHPNLLGEGTYNTKVIVTDEDGKSVEVTDTLTIKSLTWSPTKFDAIDGDGLINANDSNPQNTILQNTPMLRLVAGVDNPSNFNLKYQFQVDTNNDGTFENIGDAYYSKNSQGMSTLFGPRNLSPGTYNTRVIITDPNGRSFQLQDSFVVETNDWQILGLDSDDADYLFGGTDSNPNNYININENTLVMNVGVNNPNSIGLTYDFFVDSNNDGTFEFVNKSFARDSSVHAFFNIVTPMKVGTYDTKVVITDQNGLTQEAYDTFTVASHTSELNADNGLVDKGFNIVGLDSIDSDKVYGGVDSNINNTIGRGTQYITLTAKTTNHQSERLIYDFQIDSNNDGTFESFELFSGTADNAYAHLNTAGLVSGTYQTKVIVTDSIGFKQEVLDTFTVVKAGDVTTVPSWELGTITIDDENPQANKILQDQDSVTFVQTVNNPNGSSLNYQISLDLDQDGTFETQLAEQSSTSKTGISSKYYIFGLDSGAYDYKVTVTDSLGGSQSFTDKLTINPRAWSATSLDSDNSSAKFNSEDSNPTDLIYQGSNEIKLAAITNNSEKALLNYQFSIDSNNDGTFETIGSIDSDSTIGITYDYFSRDLAAGTYNTKVVITDVNGLSSTLTDSFTVQAPIVVSLDAADGNDTNKIGQGETQITLKGSTNNPQKTNLTYTFSIDADNDGTFEVVGSATSNTGFATIEYLPENLSPGVYQTMMEVFDQYGTSLGTKSSSFEVLPWKLNNFDSNDPDGIFGTPDLNPSNSINLGGSSVTLVSKVSNPTNQNLKYTYLIDSNSDGTFETIGSLNSSSSSGSSLIYDVSALTAGSYATKVIVTDSLNNQFELLDNFTINAPVINGFDSVDNDGTFNADSSTNVITQGDLSTQMTAGVSNPGGASLNYEFRIDLNKDGDYNDLGETVYKLISDDENIAINFDSSALTAGDYNASLLVTDGKGWSQEVNNNFIVRAWSIKDFDSDDTDGQLNTIDSNPQNIILNGNNQAVMSAYVNNPTNQTLTYYFEIDSNKDGVFETVGSVISNSAAGAYFKYNVTGLGVGTYDTNVTIVDTNGIVQTQKDKLTVSNWLITGMDSVDSATGIFGDGTEATTNNSINQGITSIIMTGGVNNPTSRALSYTFQIDSNNDGTFETIATRSESTTYGTFYDYRWGDHRHVGYNPSSLAPGTYNTKLIVTDSNGLAQEVLDSFTVKPVNPNQWSIKGIDSVDSAAGIYGDGTDSSTANNVSQFSSSIIMTGGVNNPNSVPLNYTFQIDSNKDGTFETIATRNESTTYGTFYDYRWGDHRHVGYNPSSLTPGTYNTKLIVSDATGFTQEAYNSFTITPDEWSVTGIDTVDSAAGIYGDATDANSTNTINQGTTSIIITGGVNNPTSRALSYTFQIDSNKDGTFETIATRNESTTYGTFYDYRWGDHRHVNYNPSSLAAGTYNTRMIVADSDGRAQTAYDKLTVLPWSIKGIDSVDSAAGIYGDATDANSTNTITQGTSSIIMTGGVNNPGSVLLNYTFQIDSNNDGSFETIASRSESTTYGTFYDYRWGEHRHVNYNPSSLATGTYNTKLIVSDATGLTQEAYGMFTVGSVATNTWSALGLDSIDQDQAFGGTDSNPTNTITQNTTGIYLTAGVTNTNKTGLNYEFSIDTNNDGTFELIGTAASNSATGTAMFYSPSKLVAGEYKTKVVISDTNGNIQEVLDKFTVTPYQTWNLHSLDSIDSSGAWDPSDSNIANLVYNDEMNIVLTANVSNPDNQALTYHFQIDSNNDGTFETIINKYVSTSSKGESLNYSPILLQPGEYNTKVTISDANGNSQEVVNSFTIKPKEWKITGLDSIEPDGSLGGFDGNSSNEILRGSTSMRMAVGVENTRQAMLKYEFFVDSNKDGTFEAIGDPHLSTGPSGLSILYNPRNLGLGEYSTKVRITDETGFAVETFDTFEITENSVPSWTISGIDPDDADGILEGTDSNSLNIIKQNTSNINLVAHIDNPDKALLSYQFQIDSNNDGIFENIGSVKQIQSSQDVTATFNTSALAPGNYDVKIKVFDASNLSAFSQEASGSFTVQPLNWSVKGVDTFDNHSDYGDTSDPSSTNVLNINNIPEGDHIHMTVGVSNPEQLALKYQYFIDETGNGDFVEFTRVTSSSTSGVNILFNPSGYSAGAYNIKVLITDQNGNQQLVNNVLELSNSSSSTLNTTSWSITGLDSVDYDGSYGANDSTPNNTILPGTGFISLAAGVNNADKNLLSYQFQIDSNNDGVYENIGDIQKSISAEGIYMNYSTINLSPGLYNTRVIITDPNGNSQIANGSFQVSLPPLKGFDTVDSDGVFGGNDSNINNTIKEGSTAVTMAAKVENPLGVTMNYKFYIDSDKNGIWEEIGKVVSSGENISFVYNPSNLAPGSYQTKIEVLDQSGNSQFLQDTLTVEARTNITPWSIEGFDSVDFNKQFDYVDSVPSNVIPRGTDYINLTIGFDNPYNAGLTVQYFIDTNKDGVFENIASSYTTSNSSYTTYRPDKLTVGNYNLKVVVTDQSGNSHETYDVLRVEDVDNSVKQAPWTFQSMDAVVNNSTNTVLQGSSDIDLSASVFNQFNELLTYKFEIDSNNDGIFELIGKFNSSDASTASLILDISDFAVGSYNTKVTVSDQYGNSHTGSSQLNVTAKPWSVTSVDADTSSLNNTVTEGVRSTVIGVEIENTNNSLLTYKFRVDLNQDGTYEDYLTMNSFSSNGLNAVLPLDNLLPGTYNIQVEVTDINGVQFIRTDSFTIISS